MIKTDQVQYITLMIGRVFIQPICMKRQLKTLVTKLATDQNFKQHTKTVDNVKT